MTKKILKLVSYLFLVCAIAFSLNCIVHCSGDGEGGDKNPTTTGGQDSTDDPTNGGDNASLIGTWTLTGISSSSGGDTYTIPPDQIESDPLTYTFYDDNTGVQYYQEQVLFFEWSTTGNILTSTDSHSNTNTYTYMVTTDTLTLSFKETSDDDGITYMITHTFILQENEGEGGNYHEYNKT